jgi:defect-in-organelle-trafficking protein DotC
MLKAKTILFRLAIAISLLVTGCASQKTNTGGTGSLTELKQLHGHKLTEKSDQTQFRMIGIKETALSIGAQSGLAWRAKQINAILESQNRELDQVFNFNALVLEDHVLPPVLVESRASLKLDSDTAIRLADRTYKIANQARFVTTAPVWDNYLFMNYQQPEPPHPSLLPQNTKEQAYWDEYVAQGWSNGIQQANTIYADNLARLKRDYQGMLLYRKLLTQNIVSKPYVAKTELGITGSGSDMSINDRVLRITALPQLKADSKAWKSIISSDEQ